MIEKINSIMKNSELDKIKSFSATIDPPFYVKTRDEIIKAIEDFKPDEGWLCQTDKVLVIEKGYDFNLLDKCEVLSGEFVSGDKSLHIRQSNDGWGVYIITSKYGETQLMIKEEFLAIPDKGISKLKYETFWKEVEGAYKPYVSRFAGFVKGGE